MTAGAIAEEFPIAWASVSRHLSLLKEAGLVIATRDGQNIIYSLNSTVFQDVVKHLMELPLRWRPRHA